MNKRKAKFLAKAIALASELFVDSTDRGNVPYIMHCLEVMNNVGNDPELKMIGVLHDVVEDTHVTHKDLMIMGFSYRVLQALELLTHEEDVPYEDYIAAISGNRDAIIVKMADLTHNSDIRRLKGITEKDLARMKKYHTSYTFLKNALAEYDYE